MNQADAQKIIDAKVGYGVLVDGLFLPVVGCFGDRYHHDGKVDDAKQLTLLDGKHEIGVENLGGEWYSWYTRFRGTYPMSSLDGFRNAQTEIESGRVERVYTDGLVPHTYDRYFEGERKGRKFFIGWNNGSDTFDIWTDGKAEEIHVFVRRPYGWKRDIDDHSLEVIIEPGKHTGLNATPVDEHGLRGYPGVEWEVLEHLGYVDGRRDDGGPSLVYKVLSDGEIVERLKRRGDRYFSVLPSGSGETKRGYWHVNENRHPTRPIRVRATSKRVK